MRKGDILKKKKNSYCIDLVCLCKQMSIRLLQYLVRQMCNTQTEHKATMVKLLSFTPFNWENEHFEGL